MENIAKLKKMIGDLKTWHKYSIGITLFAIITVLSFIYAMPDEYETLYSNLSESDRQEILVELQKIGVDFKEDETTSAITVKGKDVNWVRKEMTSMGLPSESGFGYETFFESSLGATQKDKELRELAGRKGQLERDIVKNFAIIESASVQLTLPEKASIFEESTQKGSASVTIGLRKGTQISEQQLIGLQHMVSTAIPGVKAEEVKVIDNEQGIISNGTGDNKSTMSTAYEKQMQIQEKTEENIIEDIRTSLTTFFGYDNLTLNVKVGINFDEIVQNIEKYSDDDSGMRSKQSAIEDTVNTEGTINPEAGVEENGDVIGYDVDAEGRPIRYEQHKEDVIENFEVGKTVETIKKNPELTNTNIVIWVDKTKMQEKGIDERQFRDAIAIAAGLIINPDGTYLNGQVRVVTIDKEVAEKEDVNETVGIALFFKENLLLVIIIAIVMLSLIGLLLFLLIRKKKNKDKLEGRKNQQNENDIQVNEIQGTSTSTGQGMFVGDEEDEDTLDLQQRTISDSTLNDDFPYGVETEQEKKKRLLRESRQKELDLRVENLGKEHPKETAELLRKWLNERR